MDEHGKGINFWRCWSWAVVAVRGTRGLAAKGGSRENGEGLAAMSAKDAEAQCFNIGRSTSQTLERYDRRFNRRKSRWIGTLRARERRGFNRRGLFREHAGSLWVPESDIPVIELSGGFGIVAQGIDWSIG